MILFPNISSKKIENVTPLTRNVLIFVQAELDANRTTMEKMLQRTEVLCARLDIDKNKHLSSDMVGYSRRQLKEVHVVLLRIKIIILTPHLHLCE